MGRDRGSHHQRHDGHDAKLGEDELRGEEDTGYGGIEGSADTCCSAGSHQYRPFPGRETEAAPECRAQTGTDVNNRSHSSNRASGADGNGGGEGLRKPRNGTNPAAVLDDCRHNLRDAVSRRLGC